MMANDSSTAVVEPTEEEAAHKAEVAKVVKRTQQYAFNGIDPDKPESEYVPHVAEAVAFGADPQVRAVKIMVFLPDEPSATWKSSFAASASAQYRVTYGEWATHSRTMVKPR